MKVKSLVVVVTVVLCLLVAPGSAGAARTHPLTNSGPYQRTCEAQGGTFGVAIDVRSLYCDKVGEPYTAFSPRELRRLRRMCERRYGAFFGIQWFIVDGTSGTGTFCSTAT